ncbi:response regulator transcription factor [Amycolatopsis sp. NPDC048633]|uniref:response regulator transcription factor n=1 Tax=Amycolatopsis sp. NPDC048633 TaxID=3157095 RepID=UPI00340F0035
MTVTVLIADDHEAIRDGLTMILNNADGVRVVGEAADGATAVRQARALRPDVTLMDVRMPGVDGITATRQVLAEGLSEVLVLTTFDLDEYVDGALRAGAAGFLLKSVEASRLIEAVKQVAAGEGVLAPQITRRVITAFAAGSREPAPAPHGLEDLTEREREVLACLGEGLTNTQIGTRLYIGETTVKTHVSRVLAKLDLRSRTHAAILARENGLTRENPASAVLRKPP